MDVDIATCALTANMHLLTFGEKKVPVSIDEIQAKRRLLDIKDWLENLDDYELDFIVGECLTRRKLIGRAVKAITWKICDKCMRTFPYHTDGCDKCASKNLRIVERRHSYDEILDDMKV